MSGDTTNVNVWSGADVLLGSLTATNPAPNVAFTMNTTVGTGVNWDFVGILDGSAGFSEAQSNDSTDFNGWGYGVVATTRKNLSITRTFTVMEDNLITLGIAYDVSALTVTGTSYTGTLKGRDLAEKFKVAFETRQGTQVKRLITKNYASVETIGDKQEGEDNVSSFPVTVKIYPTSAGIFWDTYKGVAA